MFLYNILVKVKVDSLLRPAETVFQYRIYACVYKLFVGFRFCYFLLFIFFVGISSGHFCFNNKDNYFQIICLHLFLYLYIVIQYSRKVHCFCHISNLCWCSFEKIKFSNINSLGSAVFIALASFLSWLLTFKVTESSTGHLPNSFTDLSTDTPRGYFFSKDSWPINE